MDRQRSDESTERFSAYLDTLASVIGHAARVGPMRDYCTGLLLPCERKSVEPIAAATAPGATSVSNGAEECPLIGVQSCPHLSASHCAAEACVSGALLLMLARCR